VIVRFSEIAYAGMARIMPDESRRKSLEAAIKFYVVTKAPSESRRCPAFKDIDTYIWPFWTWQILYEPRSDEFFVWHVSASNRASPDNG
jgi:hypothetical protein